MLSHQKNKVDSGVISSIKLSRDPSLGRNIQTPNEPYASKSQDLEAFNFR
jgi:hypothetical protein